jgi:hypothetical protein
MMSLRDSFVRFAASSGSTALALAVLSGLVAVVAWVVGDTDVAVGGLKGAGLGAVGTLLTRHVDALLERVRAR